MYRITSIKEPRRVRDRDGNTISITLPRHIMAPTKKGDDWSLYIGEIRLRLGGKTNFMVTHVNSSAWGTSSFRTVPFDYSRPDIEGFVRTDCAKMIADLVASLIAPGTQRDVPL